MSPSRTRRPVHRHRSRREVLTAVGGAIAVVAGTALAIWLLRPGTAGVEGTGGLASRQPRAAWLVALTIAAAIGFVWWVLKHQRRWRGNIITVVATGGFVILFVAVLSAVVWPGGFLRHPEPVPEFDPDTSTSTTLPPGFDSTTLPGETTAPAGTDTTVATTPTTTAVP